MTGPRKIVVGFGAVIGAAVLFIAVNGPTVLSDARKQTDIATGRRPAVQTTRRVTSDVPGGPVSNASADSSTDGSTDPVVVAQQKGSARTGNFYENGPESTTTIAVPTEARTVVSVPEPLNTDKVSAEEAAVRFVAIWESLFALDPTKATQVWLSVVDPTSRDAEAASV